MKSRHWIKWVVAGCLAWGGTTSFAANYYINDGFTNGDLYTSAIGHDLNPGTASSPKASLTNVVATCSLVQGDVVYIDTGNYTNSSGSVIGTNAVGVATNHIRFQGSTNGTVFASSGIDLLVAGKYLDLTDIRVLGGTDGLRLDGANFCTFERIWAITNSTAAFNFISASKTNQFRQCVAYGGANAVRIGVPGSKDNYFENCVLLASGTALYLNTQDVSNFVGCIIGGPFIFPGSAFIQATASRNIFWGMSALAPDMETVAELQRLRPGWTGCTVADPMFVNATGLDFHVLSAGGCISNGIWVTNAAVGYSPAIDFGPMSSLAYTSEPDPNGGRVNIGMYAGTSAASKSRTNAWLYAMSFNDGGMLVQTGRLEWAGGNWGPGTTVDLQISTNAGSSWSNITSGVTVTNETYTWVPTLAQQSPTLLWRVLCSTNSIASTNARPFGVRVATNAAFSYYVNDTLTNGDIYCSAIGNNANDGITAAAPKRSLQAVLDAYVLSGGDTVYVDTGNYVTNFTTLFTRFDSGTNGRPVRILGSPQGTLFGRNSTTANTLELNGASFLEFENFQLTKGSSGFAGNGSLDVTCRKILCISNNTGFSLSSSAARHVFDGCLAADNTINALSGLGAVSNQWMNGVLWGSPTILSANSNTLTVSNSVLGGGTNLFGLEVVPGDYNLVWQTQVGLTYSTFSAFQNAGLGWTHSLFADPLFANAAGGDYHLKSVMGRYNPATGLFVTNDVVHSPAIDLGDPLSTNYLSEPVPNGNRLNVGMYGGSVQASKSRTNAWLQVLSYMDGGTLDAAAGSWLRWNSGNLPGGSTVTLWLSRDSGGSWTSLVVGVNATNGAYFYTNSSTNDSSALYARWKVTLDGATPEVSSQCTTNFGYRNGSYEFYVNDGSRSNDVYCTAIGNDANLGVTPGSPMASLAALITRYQVGPGDRVYVDTGNYYYPSAPVVLTSQDSGLSTNQVHILGSTNRLAGGSMFGQAIGGAMALGFDFQSGASNIILRDILLTNVTRGVSVQNSANITLENIEVRSGTSRAFDLQANSRNIDLLRCVALGGGTGVALQQATNVTIRNSVFWQNSVNAVSVGSQVGVRLENSILASTNANAILFSVASWVGFSSDYNGIYAGPLVRVAAGGRADNLAGWITCSGGQDLHSIPGNPQMADPEHYDYHLKTEQTLGRRTPDGGRTSDSLSSPLLDAGNPSSDYSAEPLPNGGRVNIGRYGGTWEASIAVASPWLRAASFGDAGGVTNGVVPLIWTAGGGFSNQTVKVEISVNGGKTWGTTVTSGVPATNGLVNWTVSGLPDTPAAVWRVVCLENTNVASQSTNFFAIRNNPLNLYVGTADTNETVFTTGPGLSDNWTATADAPLNSLVTVFDRFDLEPGDQIWVDNGIYEETAPVLIGMKNSGTSTNPVRVAGNPLLPYSGTVLKRSSRTLDAYGIQLAYAGGVQFSSLMVSNAWIGIHAENSPAVWLDRVRVAYCVTNDLYAGVNTRVELTKSILEQSLGAALQSQTGSVVKVSNSLIRTSRFGIFLQGGDVEARNSIMESSGSQQYVYFWAGAGSRLASDNNNIRVTDGASVAGGAGRLPDRYLIDWQISAGFSNDVSSFGYDALFANAAALDFHLKSECGRYDPAVGTFVTNDTETSRLIDLGQPTAVYSNEPAPNGGRIDVGLYGNTAEASKSCGLGALVPLTMSDGGTIQGVAKLYWAWNGIPANELLTVQFSADGGSTWTNIASNVFAEVGSSGLTWSTTNFPNTAMGVWRVSTTNVPPISGQTEILFALRNAPLSYYVNDGSTVGDVYCSGIGQSVTNAGLRPDLPIDSIERLFGRVKVAHGDTIYVDTGIYRRSSPLVITLPLVATTNWLVIQGSTNEADGGTVFTNASGAVVEIQNTRSVELRDLNIHGGDQAILFTQSSSNRALRVRSVGARVSAFELGALSDQNQFIQCAALNFSRTGFHMVTVSGATAPATNFWSQGVLASAQAGTNGLAVSTGALISAGSGRLYLSNSVCMAGPAHFVYSVAPGVIHGDYNCYHQQFTNSVFTEMSGTAPVFGVNVMLLDSLGAWISENQSDSNSLAADPLLADMAEGDLHPKSAGGRYSIESGSFVTDADTSPLIDTANPSMTWSRETDPNGRRANIGPYGDDPQASRTPTNGTFVILTLNEGGVVRGTQTLRWLARGAATNAGLMVNIQLSTNSGANFQTIGTSLASLGSYVWNSTTNASSPTARWRVQSQNLLWIDASDRDFVIHNSNMTFYVNDASTSNDVYTTAPGSLDNTGLTPSSPLPSLADVLSLYNVEPGDVILIDTGYYVRSSPLAFGFLDSGTVTNPVLIQGSTNHSGSIFAGAGIQFENVRGVTLKNLRFNNLTASDAATITSSEDVMLDQVDVFQGGGNGVVIRSSSNVFLRNFSIAGMGTNGVTSQRSFNTRLEFGTIWMNQAVQVLSDTLSYDAAYVTVSNCVLGATGTRKPIYEIRGNLYADHNDLNLTGGALAALSYQSGFGREYDSVGSWSGSTGKDTNSLSHDPHFADAALGDFHLKSSAGRYDSATEMYVLTDPASENSPLIDAGDPAIACTEPAPNGARVNLGRYGNTAEASKTPTNGALTWISFNGGGRAAGTNVLLTWLARGDVTNCTVTLYYSADGGTTWSRLTNGVPATGIPASAGSWVWDSTLNQQSVEAKLKIEATCGTTTVNDRLFSVRNAPVYFYLNDSSTTNDVYCSAVGNNANTGLASNAPMADFNTLLSRYDLEGGDVVYIDTGVYRGLSPWQITQADSAGDLESTPVVFQGSTNSLVNGTVLDRSFNSIGIQVDYAIGVTLRNLTVSNTVGTAVVFNDCYNAAAEWMMIGAANVGFRLNAGSQQRVNHSLVLNANEGLVMEGRSGTTNLVISVIEHNVFWETAGGTIRMGGSISATVRNNILSTSAGQYVFSMGNSDVLYSDYNSIWLSGGGRVSRRERTIAGVSVPIIYETVGSWAAASGQDLHSYDSDPLLANPSARDFHPKSQAGRWNASLGVWTNDSVSSPLIDAGLPSSTAWTNEPAPNGGRVNIGLYGGTEWASKSSTNSALHLLTLNRGGVASGQVALNWTASGLSTGHTVRLEVSIDDGSAWTLVAAGIPAALGGLTWNSLSLPSSPLALWRVRDELETNVIAVSELNFVLHNGPVYYYVNDESTAGDVYCSAPGSPENTGATPGSPKRYVSEIVDNYNLEPGDVVYVDTGFYQTEVETTMGELDAGEFSSDPSRQVTLQGSTNELAGGSLYIVSVPEVSAFNLNDTYGIRFKHLNIVGGSNGLALDGCHFIAGEWMNIRGCVNGAKVLASSNVLFSHTAMVGNQFAGILFSGSLQDSTYVDSCILWSNQYAVYGQGGYCSTSNSIFGMVSSHSFGFYRGETPPSVFQSDYNSLYVQPGAGSGVGGLQIGAGGNARTTVYASVSAWALTTGQDSHSLAQNPQVVDPGNGDYHVKSVIGRYKLGTGWVNDTISSPLIDAGNPQGMGWTAEPDPNGRRLNIGLYGGTAQASKSPVSGWLTLLCLNDGGRASGLVDLCWSVGGAATNYTLCIEYSANNGITWTNVVCGWPASTGGYQWDSVPYGRSAQGRWRAWCLEDISIFATSVAPFILDNGGTINYYVNDGSTNWDVYCSATGDDANDGLTTNTPKANLQAILDAYELAPEDVVYVDAGTYAAGAPPVKIDQSDSGWSNLFVTIQGSTNPIAAGATVFQAPAFSTPYVFALQYAVNVRLKDLTIRNANSGVYGSQTIGCEFDNVRIENNQSSGMNFDQCVNTRLIRSVLWHNSSSSGGVAVVLNNSSMFIENSVLWGSPNAITIGSSTLKVTNSVLNANGSGKRIYTFSPSASARAEFRGDYNSYTRKNGALIAEQQSAGVGSDYYSDLPAWSAAVSSEQHSMTPDPLFANETDGDFHPQSSKGRFSNGAWVQDEGTNSPLIDAGSPAWSCTNEPPPNGGIINIGSYGNTAQASMTQTNPPWLRCIAYNDEGIMSGNVLLYWLHGGMPDLSEVQLDYSTDYEVSWHSIVSNLPVGSREYLWDVSALPLSLVLNWRVVLQSNTNIFDVSDTGVSGKPRTYDFYINDSSTNGDVWCTQPGQEWDPWVPLGTNPAIPLKNLKDLLEHYPVGAGDRIYLDTGVYTVTADTSVQLDGRNTGTATHPLKIYGSTNFQAGGTLLLGDGTTAGMNFMNLRYIELYNLRVSQAQNGLTLDNVANITFDGLEIFNCLTNGISLSAGSEVVVGHSRIWKNGQYGYVSTGSKGGESLSNSTFWGNRAGAVWCDKGLNVVNSILCATNATRLYTESAQGSVNGDYNMYNLVPGSLIGTNDMNRVAYANLLQWQARGRDPHTVVADPLFVDPTNGNFHLQSRAGYWSNGTWQVSTNTSWAIDAGDPELTAYTNEPAPTGGRLNLGAYGGTPQASKSDSSQMELLPTTLRDGGVAPDGLALYWLYRGINATNTVRIEYSLDAGATWLLMDSGMRVDSAPYNWFGTCDPSPEALWRVMIQFNTNVVGATSTPFTHRPCPLTYYVNDGSTYCDVYCTAIGSSTNVGYRSNSPLPSIQAVLDRYQLIGADGIKVDTGVYVITNAVFFNLLFSGDTTNRITLTGSTNLECSGSWLQAATGVQIPAFHFFGAHDVNVSNFRMSGFVNALTLDGVSRCTLSDLDVQGSIGPGIEIVRSPDIRLSRVLIREGLTNGLATAASLFTMDSCVLWSNGYSAISLGNGSQVDISNSVIEVSGVGNYCYNVPTSAVLRSDYNDLFLQSGAQLAFVNGLQYEKLPQWVRGTTLDRHSLNADPLFHDPANGDFHLRSVAGRYQPGTGWVQDVHDTNVTFIDDPCLGLISNSSQGVADFSPLIDMCALNAAWSNEPAPNGGRRNMGLYGNTWQASKSNTNRWLQAITAMSGGIMYGGINLTWGYGGPMSTGELVRLEYSYDNGTEHWIRIGETYVGMGEYFWQSDLTQAGIEIWMTSPAARWRIFLLSDTNVYDMTETYFGLRNSPFKYYVNDTSTVNDVYTTTFGNDCNLGFYAAVPKLTLNALLRDVDLEPTDQIYIDTGVYTIPNGMPVIWEASDGGGSGQPVTVHGSTHADATLFVVTDLVGAVSFTVEAGNVDMQDLLFSGVSANFRGSDLTVRNVALTNGSVEFTGNGLVVSNLSLVRGSLRMFGNDSTFENVRIDHGSVSLSGRSNRLDRMQQLWGEASILGTNVSMMHSVVYTTNNMQTGVVVNAISAVVSNCTVVSSRGVALGKTGAGTLRLGHSILVAGGTESSSVISWDDGGLVSDWNDLLARDDSWLGIREGKWETLSYWQAASHQDANSVSFDPLFQNEAQGDFHVNSKTGRWSPAFNTWDVDSVHSPVIDLGDPWIGTGEEPAPNGYRRNLGAFGGTVQASKSLTTLWLTALTQNDGGVLKGTNVVLRWAAGNAGGKTVTLEYYDGNSWTNIASGLSATDGSYVWNSTLFPDTFSGRWRVVAEDGSGVSDQTDSTFPLRNQSHPFYVNDADQTGDIYCASIGSAANSGLSNSAPKLTLQQILDAYDLEGGDTVYVDTGTYSSTTDVRILWSRGGGTNADVVIQGNTNGAFTVMIRSGSTNYPAVGLNVKASRIQVNNMAIRGADRGVLLESNRYAQIRNTVFSGSKIGAYVDTSQNTTIRNSAFWNTDWGISLNNTRTSTLVNLTFAGIKSECVRMTNSVIDILQNNIYIPAAGAYAYSIGIATSLLTSATMDYNLYDFSNEGSGFYAGGTNVFRKWQLTLNKDFRSAVTNADLADIESGDFHSKSEYGRWTPGGWVLDTNTSWAVDHGNPNNDFSQEPAPNGGRLNIGMGGNTYQASKGSTATNYTIRTLNDPEMVISQSDQFWPMIWSAHLVDSNEWVEVQFSGDCGVNWITLTNVPAYTEYYIFQARVEFQTAGGAWRVVGVNNTNIWAASSNCFLVRYRDLGILNRPRPVNGLMRFDWEGGIQGLRYRIEYSDDFGQTWSEWASKYNGPALINLSNFVISGGQSQLYYTFEDRTSYLRRTRWYRIWQIPK